MQNGTPLKFNIPVPFPKNDGLKTTFLLGWYNFGGELLHFRGVSLNYCSLTLTYKKLESSNTVHNSEILHDLISNSHSLMHSRWFKPKVFFPPNMVFSAKLCWLCDQSKNVEARGSSLKLSHGFVKAYFRKADDACMQFPLMFLYE